MVGRRCRRRQTEERPQTQRAGRPPRNRPLRVKAFAIPDEQQPDIPAGRQTRSAHPCIDRRAQLLDERIEAGRVQNLLQPLVEGVPAVLCGHHTSPAQPRHHRLCRLRMMQATVPPGGALPRPRPLGQGTERTPNGKPLGRRLTPMMAYRPRSKLLANTSTPTSTHTRTATDPLGEGSCRVVKRGECRGSPVASRGGSSGAARSPRATTMDARPRAQARVRPTNRPDTAHLREERRRFQGSRPIAFPTEHFSEQIAISTATR